jgi:hypothetical protein
VTTPQLTPDEQLATEVALRDYLASEAAYYRRRADTGHDRTHAIQLEEWVTQLDAVIANRRMARRADPVP